MSFVTLFLFSGAQQRFCLSEMRLTVRRISHLGQGSRSQAPFLLRI